MVQVLVFAFDQGIASRTLAFMTPTNIDLLLLESRSQAIRDFISRIDLVTYSHILGLGKTDMGRTGIRVETKATSNFRGNDSLEEVIALPSFMIGNDFTYSTQIGSSYCNLVSYLMASRIAREKSQTQYSFIHIPKTFDPLVTSEIISRQLVASTSDA